MKKINKENKLNAIISTIIILLPTIFGIIFWNKIPINNSFGDSIKSIKIGMIFVLPLILLLTHWLCVFLTIRDPKNKGQNNKIMGIVFYIMPVMTLLINGCTFVQLANIDFNVPFFVNVFCGVLLVFIGNYLPKVKQNSTMGIKISWTLNNEENWNATHRLGGKVWVIGGFILLLSLVCPTSIQIPILIAVLILITIVPAVYSYVYYKKQVKNSTYSKEKVMESKKQKTYMIATSVLLILTLIFVSVLMFTGNIETELNDNSFAIKADYYDDLEVNYKDIDEIKIIDDFDKGSRVAGFQNVKLSMGIFKNDSLNKYTCYLYNKSDKCILLKDGTKSLVISLSTDDDTNNLYNDLKDKIEK